MNDEVAIYLTLLQGESTSWFTNDRISKEQAYERLKEYTEEDFGYDVKAWKRYFDQFDLSTREGQDMAWKGRVKKIAKFNEEYRKSKKKKDNNDS